MKRVVMVLMMVTAGIGYAVSWTSDKPDSAKIEILFDDFFREYLKLSPETGSQLGLPPEGNYIFDRTGLDDYSDAGIKEGHDLNVKFLDRLHEIDTTKITAAQKVDARILAWFLELMLEGEQFTDQRYYTDHLSGVHAQIINLMTTYHSIDDVNDARDYLARLEKIPLRFNQIFQRVEAQEKKGIRPPAFILERTIASVKDFLNAEPTENLLYVDFKNKLAAAGIDSLTQKQLCDRAEIITRENLYPVFNAYLERLKISAQDADTLAGVWKLPNGDKYYEFCLKSLTSLSITPEEAFQLGLQEVKTLQDQGRALMDSLGIRGGATYGGLAQQYQAYINRPEAGDSFQYPDAPEARQMVLADYQAIIDSVWTWLPRSFAYIPKTPVTVQRVPEYQEQSGLTYYERASLDGKRKAVFYVNLAQIWPKPVMRPLIFHETIPGHHFQIAVQQELTQDRMFKNLFMAGGFIEGWAMYAQGLGAESGWLPDIYSRIAEINSQLFRAVRIVADVGLHYKRWSKEQTRKYMEDNLGWGSINEIDRYIVWPGQACSYNLGKLKILELRDKAKKELGPKFNLPDFHMVVLKNGALPLDILEERVAAYIAENK